MPKNTYSLGGLTFTSKDAIRKHIRQILASLSVGETITDQAHDFVRDLLEWHPSASQKIGAGVARFEVHIPKPWNTKGVLLVRVDGTSTDFSYNVCLNPKLADQLVKFKSACRSAIADQVIAYKKRHFAGSNYATCELTGEKIHWDDAHVDHYPVAFADLLERYIAESGLDVKSVAFVHGDHQTFEKFADFRIEKDWADWHGRHTQFRVIERSENIRLGRHGGNAA